MLHNKRFSSGITGLIDKAGRVTGLIDESSPDDTPDDGTSVEQEDYGDCPAAEKFDLKKQKLNVEVNKLNAELKQFNQNIEERKVYTDKLFRLTKCWLIFVAVLIFTVAVEVEFIPIKFSLSDKVLITVLTTTTVNVIGLFVYVARYLFPDIAPKAPQQKNPHT